MYLWVIPLILFTFIVVARMRKKQAQLHKLPRGPPGYPLLGHLHLFRSRAYPDLFRMLTDWASKYGEIYPLSLGGKKIYIVNGYDCITEVFNNPGLDGRSPSATFVDALGEGEGPASAQGASWSCQRHHAMKYFSGAADYMERAVAEEAAIILSRLSDSSQASFDLQHDLYRPALYNILCKVTFGKRFDFGDEDFRVFAEALDTMFEQSGPATLNYSLSLPVGPSRNIRDKLIGLKTLFIKLIQERREFLAAHPSSACCYVDNYLLLQQDTAAARHFTDDNLVWAIFEMCLGGTNVPKNALASILVYLINNPEVQVKCQAELDGVLNGSSPSFADRHRLPYVQATIAECMRLSNVTPLAVPRVATRNISVRGHVFPTGSVFMSNLYSFMMDSSTFQDPEKFSPERFLDSEGNYHRPKELAPFGIGMRSCLGENLAWMELFLITSSVLQRMSVSTPEGENPPTVTTGTTGVARSPLPFRVHVQEREASLKTESE